MSKQFELLNEEMGELKKLVEQLKTERRERLKNELKK